ncbi:MAG: hypothetical protein IJU45_00530 [Clostridia bacterium]|nr:hypothetical protein [Clostridia bacterium]
MIAEFYGLPGSGKSTQVNLIKEHFPDKTELIVFSKKILSKKNINNIFTGEFISFSFKLLRLWILKLISIKSDIFKKKKFKDELTTAFYFEALYLEFMYLRDNEKYDTLYIVDHGLFQCLASLVWDKEKLNKKSDQVMLHIIKNFGSSIYYVYISGCENEELYNRIMNRDVEIRLKSYKKEDAFKVFDNLRDLFSKTERLLSDEGKTIRIENSSGIDAGFDKLCEFFKIKGE